MAATNPYKPIRIITINTPTRPMQEGMREESRNSLSKMKMATAVNCRTAKKRWVSPFTVRLEPSKSVGKMATPQVADDGEGQKDQGPQPYGFHGRPGGHDEQEGEVPEKGHGSGSEEPRSAGTDPVIADRMGDGGIDSPVPDMQDDHDHEIGQGAGYADGAGKIAENAEINHQGTRLSRLSSVTLHRKGPRGEDE